MDSTRPVFVLVTREETSIKVALLAASVPALLMLAPVIVLVPSVASITPSKMVATEPPKIWLFCSSIVDGCRQPCSRPNQVRQGVGEGDIARESVVRIVRSIRRAWRTARRGGKY